MTTRNKCPFSKGKIYYEKKIGYKLKFVEHDIDGYYVFKIIGDDEYEEFSTKAPWDIAHSYSSYQNYIKSQQKQEVIKPVEIMDM